MEEISKTLVVLWTPWLTLVFGFLPIHFKHRIHIIEKELLRRTVSDTDGRRRLIELTEKGRQLQEMCRRIFFETEALMMEGLSPQEQELLFDLLLRVAANLEEDRKV